jgi:hypothetical protein
MLGTSTGTPYWFPFRRDGFKPIDAVPLYNREPSTREYSPAIVKVEIVKGESGIALKMKLYYRLSEKRLTPMEPRIFSIADDRKRSVGSVVPFPERRTGPL